VHAAGPHYCIHSCMLLLLKSCHKKSVLAVHKAPALSDYALQSYGEGEKWSSSERAFCEPYSLSNILSHVLSALLTCSFILSVATWNRFSLKITLPWGSRIMHLPLMIVGCSTRKNLKLTRREFLCSHHCAIKSWVFISEEIFL
jgi:hypothetical protein